MLLQFERNLCTSCEITWLSRSPACERVSRLKRSYPDKNIYVDISDKTRLATRVNNISLKLPRVRRTVLLNNRLPEFDSEKYSVKKNRTTPKTQSFEESEKAMILKLHDLQHIIGIILQPLAKKMNANYLHCSSSYNVVEKKARSRSSHALSGGCNILPNALPCCFQTLPVSMSPSPPPLPWTYFTRSQFTRTVRTWNSDNKLLLNLLKIVQRRIE